MEPMQEILETVREIRKGQLEALEWRRRYVRRVRITSAFVLVVVVAYVTWAVIVLKS